MLDFNDAPDQSDLRAPFRKIDFFLMGRSRVMNTWLSIPHATTATSAVLELIFIPINGLTLPRETEGVISFPFGRMCGA